MSTPPYHGAQVGAGERLLVHAAVAALGGAVLWDSFSQQGASAYFPTAIGCGLILLSAVSALKVVPRRLLTSEATLVKGLGGLALLAVFALLAGEAGFLSTALLFIPAMALLGGDRNVPRVALATVSFVALAYVVFHVVFAQSFPPEFILGGR